MYTPSERITIDKIVSQFPEFSDAHLEFFALMVKATNEHQLLLNPESDIFKYQWASLESKSKEYQWLIDTTLANREALRTDYQGGAQYDLSEIEPDRDIDMSNDEIQSLL